MSVTQIPSSKPSVQPMGALGTYPLALPMSPGLWKITTDTTQTFTTAQLYFQSAAGYRYGAVVRGGQGYVALPETVTSVTLAAGSFPLLMGFERFPGYPLIAGPTNVGLVYHTPISPYSVTLTYTPPSGATSIGIYYTNGAFVDLASTSGSNTFNLPTAPTFDQAYPMLVVAKDGNGIWGLGSTHDDPYPYAFFTSSGTYTTPAWSTTADIYAVGGGGGGGGSILFSNGVATGGGGGAGEFEELIGVATSGTYAVTIGAGGSGGGAAAATPPTSGGTTSFGALLSVGGGGYGAQSNTAASSGGASGGGATIYAAKAAGISGAGTSGGDSGGYWDKNNGVQGTGGSGGGFANAAGPVNLANADPSAPGTGVTRFTNIQMGNGGRGQTAGLNYTSGAVAATGYGGGGGAGGGRWPNSTSANAGASGTSGVVIVYAKP